MEQNQLHILFTTQWMGMSRAVVALDTETGQTFEAVLTPWIVGGGQGEKINACIPITYEDVRRLARKAEGIDPTTFDDLNEHTWKNHIPNHFF